MKTYNEHFNEAWKGLEEIHPTANLPNGYSFNLQEVHTALEIKKLRPGTREWASWIHDLLEVLTTGQRERFMRILGDGEGRFAYLYVPFEVEKRKAGERHLT